MRTRFVVAHKDELNQDEQRAIVGKACGPHTSAEEVEQLSGLGLFTDRDLFQLAMSALKQTQTKLETTERARAKVHGETAWKVLCVTRSKATGISTGNKGATSGGAVFDDARHIIVSTCFGDNGVP